MKRFFYIEKRLFYLFLPSILFTFLVAMVNVDIAKHYKYTVLDMPFLLSYHYFDIHSKNFFVTIFSFMMHNLYLAYLLMNYLYDDLKEKSSIVFTRTNKKIRWFLLKVANLLLYIILYYALQFSMTLFTSLAFGMKSFYDVFMIVELWIHVVLVGFCIVLLMNILSLFFNPAYAYIFVVGSCMIGLFSMTYFVEFQKESLEIIKYIPTSIGIYTLHRDIYYGRDVFEFFLEDYVLMYSYLKMMFFCSICIVVGGYRIKRKDLL